MEVTNKTKTVFLEVMGDHPMNRILDFLIIFNKFDYSKKEIARNSHVSYATLKYLWPNLERIGLVTFTRKIGKATLYKLNTENPIVKQLMKTYHIISMTIAKKELELEEEEVKVK
ncbi:MAG: hypothetical protein ISS25_02910 [Nanoarchaeota archaeon]|nr:hypothetical protein [DPANN group archaeon]MBL7116751.1 hypothetical protein [Nanoarchaeota archaeon]